MNISQAEQAEICNNVLLKYCCSRRYYYNLTLVTLNGGVNPFGLFSIHTKPF
jgi:hypothetical protein